MKSQKGNAGVGCLVVVVLFFVGWHFLKIWWVDLEKGWQIGIVACVGALIVWVVSTYEKTPEKKEKRWDTGEPDRIEHGSAHFTDIEDGRLESGDDKPGAFLLAHANGKHLKHAGHVLGVAPTGAGKGIGLAVPNLLRYEGSAFVLDLKGELYAVTSRRRREMGQQVYLIDPFGVSEDQSAGFNWLEGLDASQPDIVSDAGALADTIVVPDPKSQDSFWDDTARDLIRGIIIHLATLDDPERQTIGELRRILTMNLMTVLEEMEINPDGFEIPARAAASFLAKADRERSAVLSTAIRHTAFLDDPRLSSAVSKADFRIADLVTGRATVYLTIPPAQLAGSIRFIRGCVGLTLAALTRSRTRPEIPVAFMLDEFAALGHMEAVEKGMAIMRGYGAQFFLLVQDLGQIKAVYPKWQSLTGNAAKVFFGAADFDTAKYISESLGSTTIEYKTRGSSSGSSSSSAGMFSKNQDTSSGSSGTSEQQHLQKRELMTPDEIMRLPATMVLVFIAGEAPFCLGRLNYLEEGQGFLEQANSNPYH